MAEYNRYQVFKVRNAYTIEFWKSFKTAKDALLYKSSMSNMYQGDTFVVLKELDEQAIIEGKEDDYSIEEAKSRVWGTGEDY